MIKILRKHRNWLMIVIAILALPFCIYFVKSDPALIRSDEFAKVYGRKVTVIEARRAARIFELARSVGLIDFLQDLASSATSREEMFEQFTINLIILRHEAEQLGFEPAEPDVVEAVKNFPAFKGESGFESAKYDEVERTVLPSLGFTDEQLRELAHDQLCLQRIKQILSASVSIPESESKSNFEQAYGRNFASVVRLHSSDFMKQVQVSDDDIKKYYDEHKAELKTEEKRKVEFVRFGLTEEQKKLKDKNRIDALQKLADRANDFSQGLLEKGADFHQVAGKFLLPVDSTGEFSQSAPDPKLKADPQLIQAAFKLTPQEPNSDAIQNADGFMVLHLAGTVEARPLSLEEAKLKIVDQVKAERSREMASTKGRQAAQSLQESLKAKDPLNLALQKAGGLKPEKLEPFTFAQSIEVQQSSEKTKNEPAEKPKNEPADMMAIKNTAAQLQPGEASDFVPWVDGGIIVLLEKREPPDPAKYQKEKAAFDQRYLENHRQFVFLDWLRTRQIDARVQAVPAKG